MTTPSNGSTATVNAATAAASSAATTAQAAASNVSQAVTPSSPPDPVAAATAAALSALVAQLPNVEDSEALCRIAGEIKAYADDTVVHALINSVPVPGQ